MGRTVFSVTIFPLVFGGAIAVAIALLERGENPALSYIVPTVMAYGLVFGLERVIPFREEWKRSHGDVGVDLGHIVVSGTVGVEVPKLLVGMIGVTLAGMTGGALGIWPVHWPLVPQLVLACVFGELFLYWIHRLTHEVDLLWRFHATHHSAPRLYFLNAGRFHPVDLMLSYVSWYVPFLVLGAGPEIVALHTVVLAVHGVFQHANLPVRLGPLNWVFSMAELHRWHHSRVLEEANSNYGQNLIIWDVVFGTRYLPADREPPVDVGLTDLPTFPMDYLGQIASPFRWAAIRRGE